MPFYYDLVRSFTSNASGGTATTHAAVQTVANQETVGISGVYVASRFGTAGGAQLRVIDAVTTLAGAAGGAGGAQTPRPRNVRGAVAGQATWLVDSATLGAGTGLTNRVSIGFAQTGGMGGWVATEPSNKIQIMPNSPTAANPKDVEFASLATTASVTADLTVEYSEGV